jgi:hypothetical protein
MLLATSVDRGVFIKLKEILRGLSRSSESAEHFAQGGKKEKGVFRLTRNYAKAAGVRRKQNLHRLGCSPVFGRVV